MMVMMQLPLQLFCCFNTLEKMAIADIGDAVYASAGGFVVVDFEDAVAFLSRQLYCSG